MLTLKENRYQHDKSKTQKLDNYLENIVTFEFRKMISNLNKDRKIIVKKYKMH